MIDLNFGYFTNNYQNLALSVYATIGFVLFGVFAVESFAPAIDSAFFVQENHVGVFYRDSDPFEFHHSKAMIYWFYYCAAWL
jgi:hypothetical protein